jgi:hypothetical protein
VSSERCSHVNRGGGRSPPRIVFLPETTDAENFGELVRAAAADLAGGLLGRRCHMCLNKERRAASGVPASRRER